MNKQNVTLSLPKSLIKQAKILAVTPNPDKPVVDPAVGDSNRVISTKDFLKIMILHRAKSMEQIDKKLYALCPMLYAVLSIHK